MATETPGSTVQTDDLIRQLKLTLADKGIAEGLGLVLDDLQHKLPSRSKKFDTLIILEGRYNELMRSKHHNSIAQDDLSVELSKLSESVLEFINNLEDEDFAEPKKDDEVKPDARVGKVLYAIPPEMQIAEEVECRVWIAFDLESLKMEIQSVADQELRDVRVSDVMGVELFDHGKNEAFEIVTYDEQIQKVEEGLSTQWTFFVTPQKEGKFPLILKISIVLVDENDEKIFKTVVLREVIHISTTASAEEVKALVKEAQQFTFLLIPAGGAGGAKGAGAIAEKTGTGGTGGAGGPAGRWQKTPGTVKAVVGSALAVVAALILWFTVGPGGKGGEPADRTAWNEARRSGDTTALQNFMVAFPESDYQPDAEWLLDHWRDSLAGFSVFIVEEKPELPVDSLQAELLADSLATGDTAVQTAPATPATVDPAPPSGQRTPGRETPRPATTRPRPAPATPAAPAVQNPSSGERPAGTAATGSSQPATTEPAAAAPLAAEPAEPAETAVPEKPTDYRNAAAKPLHPDCVNKQEDRRESCTANRIVDTVMEGLRGGIQEQKEAVHGTCQVNFVISKTGEVTGIEVTKSDNQQLADIVTGILRQLPVFIPGRNKEGENIDVRYILPVRINDK